MGLLGFKLLLTKCVIQRQESLWPKATSCHTSLAWFPQKANFSLILGTLGPATLFCTFSSWGSEQVWWASLSEFAVRNCSKFHSNATVAPCSSSLQQSWSWWWLVFAVAVFSFISFAFRGYNYIFHSPLSSLQTLPYTLLCFFQLCFFPINCSYMYNLLGLYNISYTFSGLTIWYWITKDCALPLGRLFLSLSAFLSWLQILV